MCVHVCLPTSHVPQSLLTTMFEPELACPVVRVLAAAPMSAGSCSNLGSLRRAFPSASHVAVSVVLMSQGRNA